jgi:hypothetical protein
MEWFGAGRSSFSVRLDAFDRDRLTLGSDACLPEITAWHVFEILSCYTNESSRVSLKAIINHARVKLAYYVH